jgi:hypothetical protein
MIRCPFHNCEECPNLGVCNLDMIPVIFLQQVDPIYNAAGLIIDIKSKDL